jgi:hypothetical protein
MIAGKPSTQAAPPEKFPETALREAGYGAVWHDRRTGMAPPFSPGVRSRSRVVEACPGGPDDIHSRYCEALIDDVLVGASIFPTAIQRPDPGSITNSAGSTEVTLRYYSHPVWLLREDRSLKIHQQFFQHFNL